MVLSRACTPLVKRGDRRGPLSQIGHSFRKAVDLEFDHHLNREDTRRLARK